MAMAAMRSELGRRVEALVAGRPRSLVRRLSAVVAAVVLAAGIVSVPAPRLSMARAAAVDASSAATPLANSSTPAAAPPGPRQASTRSDVSDGQPRRSAVRSPSDGGATVRVRGPSIRVMLSPQALMVEGSQERRGGPGNSASNVERRVMTSGTPNRRILQSRTARNRRMLLPIPDSLRPSPR